MVKAITAKNEVIENYDALNYPEGVTKIREIAPRVFMQDKKHWAMNSYAGEGIIELEDERGYKHDRSGCLHSECSIVYPCHEPKVAVYRQYWSKKGRVSCFLSYPGAMGAVPNYFWEIYCLEGRLFEDIERFDTEEECERRIIELLS